ncbi:MAG: hypothetical protein HYX34_13395 [Actinobacteria bacterium]|nr:hypothetical protein [Actinomycetota bacterium]
MVARPAPDLRSLGTRARPLTLGAERVLPALPVLAPLLPGRGLRRGSTIGVSGPGATSLALALVAGASQAGSWVVTVGVEDLGFVAAGELGVDLERLVVVAAPPPGSWGTVVAALADAFDVVIVRTDHRIRGSDARRLAARARERGGVLCRLPGRGRWPEPADVELTVTAATWAGLAPGPHGAGRLSARRVEVVRSGRREAARPVRAELWLPGPDGAVAPVAVRPAAASPTTPTTPTTPTAPAAGGLHCPQAWVEPSRTA